MEPEQDFFHVLKGRPRLLVSGRFGLLLEIEFFSKMRASRTTHQRLAQPLIVRDTPRYAKPVTEHYNDDRGDVTGYTKPLV